MQIVLSIAPMFLVIVLGILARKRGFLPREFVGPANRLAMNLAIPALLFRAVYKTPVEAAFQLTPTLVGCGLIAAMWLGSLLLSPLLAPNRPGKPGRRASWMQCTYHGNLGFMGLATLYYSQGEAGLGSASLLVALMNITHNLFSVFTLASLGSRANAGGPKWKSFLRNPIILGTSSGLVVSLLHLPVPQFLDRTLAIVAGMGLPLALLIIGATLDIQKVKGDWGAIASLSLAKLFILPAAALGLMLYLGGGAQPTAAVVLLLAQPCGTLAAIMAGSMGGDTELASAAVSLTTVASALTLSMWLLIVAAL